MDKNATDIWLFGRPRPDLSEQETAALFAEHLKREPLPAGRVDNKGSSLVEERPQVWLLTQEESEDLRNRLRPFLAINRIEPVRSREDEVMDAIRAIGRS